MVGSPPHKGAEDLEASAEANGPPKPPTGGPSPERKAWAGSWLFWCWINKLINLGYKKPLQVGHVSFLKMVKCPYTVRRHGVEDSTV